MTESSQMEPTGQFRGRRAEDLTVYVTESMCEMHHKLMEAQLEVLRQKDKSLEDKISGVEKRLDSIDQKIGDLLKLQQQLNNYLLYLAIGIALTLVGVIMGRALDFGWLL